jgi:hypothetical protein
MTHNSLIPSVLVLGLVFATALSHPLPSEAAGLYKVTAPDGTVTYSDRPQPVAPGAAAPAPARPPVPNREPTPKTGGATADEVLDLSSVRPQLAATPARVAGEFKPRGARLNAEDTATLEQILAR